MFIPKVRRRADTPDYFSTQATADLQRSTRSGISGRQSQVSPQGDKVLLLNYRNAPHRMVYDTIKVIDENKAIGVRHLGEFPKGLEIATFVMALHNYPFEKMSVEDHNVIFSGENTTVPQPTALQGQWDGHAVFITRPSATLLNQANPVAFRLGFRQTAEGKVGTLSAGTAQLIDFTTFHDEIRMIDQDKLICKWVSPELNPDLQQGLGSYLEPRGDRFAFYYILKRARSGYHGGIAAIYSGGPKSPQFAKIAPAQWHSAASPQAVSVQQSAFSTPHAPAALHIEPRNAAGRRNR